MEKPKKKPKILFIIIIVAALVYVFLLESFGAKYFILIYLGYFLVMFLFKLYRGRDIFILNMKVTEAKIFGKPLDRDQWGKGELKNKKVKFVLKKPKDKKNYSVDKPKTLDDEDLIREKANDWDYNLY